MRLIDMPAIQPPSTRAIPGRDEQADARGAFGDLIGRDAPGSRIDARTAPKEKPDEAALAPNDEPEVEVDDLFVSAAAKEFAADRPLVRSRPAGDREAETGPAAADARLRPPGRAHIDWLALRMPKEDQAPPADGAELTIEDALPVAPATDVAEDTVAAPQQSAQADARLVAAVARRDERSPDERARPSMRAEAARANVVDAPVRPTPPAADTRAGEPRLAEPHAREVPARAASQPTLVQQRAAPMAEPRLSEQSARPVTAVSVQTVPAFAPAMQSPAQTVLGAIREEAPQLARSAGAAATQPHAAEPMRILRIQLHPLELGTVTARLSLQGGEMSVELQTETRDAASKLQADSNEIAKALRGLGIEIDRVTVTQQPSTNTQQQGQQGQQAAFERSGERFANEGGEGGRQNGQRGAANGATGFEGERNAGDSQGSRGVYI